MDFRCNNSIHDFCFNGGTCTEVAIGGSNETTRQVCSCTGEYTHDFEWFHFSDCSRHKDSGMILVIQLAILLVIVLALLAREVIWRLSKDAWKIGTALIIFLVLSFCFALSLYFQDGCYEACAVFSNLTFISATALSVTARTAVLKPLFSLQKNEFKRLRMIMLSWTTGLCISHVAVLVAMFALCRDEDPQYYNIAALVGTILLWFSGVSQCVLGWVAAHKLKKELYRTVSMDANSQVQETSKIMIVRLTHFQTGMTMVIVPFVLMLLAVPITALVLSAFPYFYVLVYLTMDVAIAMALAVLFFLKKTAIPVGISKSSTKDKDKDQTVTVFISQGH